MESLKIKGQSIPKLGLGTYRLTGSQGIAVVEAAIEMGYTHIDTAQMYENEKEVGTALKNSGKPRENIWLTTKVWPSNLSREKFLPSVEESLAKLQVSKVDLLLIHWPSKEVRLEEAVEQLIKAKEKSFADNIGVSNFPSEMVRTAVGVGADLMTNQVEYHPYLSQHSLKQVLDSFGISLTAYRPIVKGQVNEDPVILKIAEKYGKSGVQVALRWLIQQEAVMTIPMTSKIHRLKENMDIFDFQLEAEEMNLISDLTAAKRRFIDPDWGPEWDE
ncbi:MAG: aldo/keto reductase [Bacteroidia bacterium]|nr:aldo/keto reductase [Bacteroidia bacterium]